MFHLRTSLRTIKPQKRTTPLLRRADALLHWVSDEIAIGGRLFLDTTVYLDILHGRTTEPVDQLLRYRICHHSAVCLAELTHVFGRLDPANPSTKAALHTVRDIIETIPEHRLHAPDTITWSNAGMLAGEFVRLHAIPKGAGQERKALNDALIYLQARSLGASVLTGNVADFDYLNQLVPSGRVVFYRDRNAA